MDHLNLSVIELSQALAKREFSCVEYSQTLVARTQALSNLNGYVGFDPAPFLAQASLADARRSQGVDLPLLGVPIALKDNINTRELPTSAGTGALKGKTPLSDADVTRRLMEAGAIISGKANMHELAFGISTNNAVTGTARNPWALDRAPGGSSGGSGVVVSARLVPAAIGTDTGASVRLPAALCGVAGLRPTVGRVSGRGIAPISSTRDTAGPIARSVADLALLDSVLTGDNAPTGTCQLRGLRLGVAHKRFWENLDAPVESVMQSVLDELRSCGVVLVDVELPGIDALNDATSFQVALYEFLDEMPHYLKESGFDVDLTQLLAQVGSPDVAGLLQPLLTGSAIPEPVYREALRARARLQQLYKETFAQRDVRALVFPTSPMTARPISADETIEFGGQRIAAFPAFIRNLDPGSNAAIPGVTLPAGIASDGLPVGLALDGPAGTDRQLLAIAAAIESILPPISFPQI
jgi:Asp-tRNA(Asn)/Glu-tRNA(Gln) amidotransferase A subunit family amidase